MYKPDLLNSCCPQYTIRLAVDKVEVAKDQRKVLRKFNRFACGGEAGEQGREFDLDYEVHLPENIPTEIKGKKLRYSTCKPNFEVRLMEATFTKEKYDLFRRYQIEIHHEDPEDVSASGFRRFLCSNPFPDNTKELTLEQIRKKGGAIHQGYYYNGKLIAMAVLDVLPEQCVSSVYFLWDPEYKSLDLGKVGALREIVFARDLGVPYYYLGYYIHSCVKMRYKGDYKPSELLDPQSRPGKPQWFALEKFQQKFNDTGYASLLGDEQAVPETELNDVVVDSARPSRYFTLQLPGIFTMNELRKEYNIWNAKMLIQLEDKKDSSDEDEELKLAPMTLKAVHSIYKYQAIVNMVSELAATIGPTLAREFSIVLR